MVRTRSVSQWDTKHKKKNNFLLPSFFGLTAYPRAQYHHPPQKPLNIKLRRLKPNKQKTKIRDPTNKSKVRRGSSHQLGRTANKSVEREKKPQKILFVGLGGKTQHQKPDRNRFECVPRVCVCVCVCLGIRYLGSLDAGKVNRQRQQSSARNKSKAIAKANGEEKSP